MSRYFKYTPSQNEFTTLRFQDDGAHSLTIKTFDTNALLIDGDEPEIVAIVQQQPIEIGFTEIYFDEFFLLASQSSQAKFMLENSAKKFKEDCGGLTNQASTNEMLSWEKQEMRARKYLEDPLVGCPQLDMLALSRGLGETVDQLAQKIVANAEAYETAYFALLGKYQQKKKAVFEV